MDWAKAYEVLSGWFGPVGALLIAALVSGYFGMWVFGRNYDKSEARNERLEALLKESLAQNEQLLGLLDPDPRRRTRG